MRKVTLISGDGIGPEVIEAAMRVVNATGVLIHWKIAYAGVNAAKNMGNPLPEETLESIRATGVALKGPCGTPIGGGFASVNVELRKRFGLFANIRPVKSIPGARSRYENVDLVIFREGTEGSYGGKETVIRDTTGVVQVRGESITTRAICTKFFWQVLNYALKHNRKKITIVHKANINKEAGELFLNTGHKLFEAMVGEKSPFTIEDMIVDNAAQKLVLDPTQFDVLAMNNEHGDILSDLCAGLVGGLGLVPGANVGGDCAIFEAAHGTAPDIAGKGIANPTAMILSAAMMLDHLGENKAADRIRSAIGHMYRTKQVTRDIDSEGGLDTQTFANVLVEEVKYLSR